MRDISLTALYAFNAESSFDIFSELDLPGLKIRAILGLYVKSNLLFLNLKGVSTFLLLQ